ncbi:MAG: dihydropteroate synthase [Chitinispirillaceae bacterium]|nr:dihydropteroate synthase [Chitinispirillaceae bacterium]
MKKVDFFRDTEEKKFYIMGIINVTPDSFYDGGRYFSSENAIEQARKLAEEGADIIDIGGASSRPGAEMVEPEEEKRRVLPVVKEVVKFFKGPVSIDTTSSYVAEAAIEEGAQWINDISAGRFDNKIIDVALKSGCKVILMHSRETPKTMQNNPFYYNVVSEVKEELLERVNIFLEAGVKREQILLDPGIGFAKRAEDNIELIKGLSEIVNLDFPIVIGTSRKSFIGKLTGKENPEERLYGTLGSIAAAYLKGALIFRVHDVAATYDMLKVFVALTS